MSLLDAWLPQYQFVERHSLAVNASEMALWNAVKTVTPAEVGVLGALMAIRSLPARISGQMPPALAKGASILEAVLSTKYVVMLEERPPRELAIGMVGQFWKLDGGPRIDLPTAGDFAAFHTPGFLRVAINFEVAANLISTETRVQALDEEARRRFRFYWALIRPGSGWIRMAWLRAISKRALRT